VKASTTRAQRRIHNFFALQNDFFPLLFLLLRVLRECVDRFMGKLFLAIKREVIAATSILTGRLRSAGMNGRQPLGFYCTRFTHTHTHGDGHTVFRAPEESDAFVGGQKTPLVKAIAMGKKVRRNCRLRVEEWKSGK